jgi:hypothetical protein
MMNVVRRIVVGIAGVVLVALALELFAPKAVHAVVSTLVTVSNTSGNPVPTMAVDTRNVNVVNTPNVNVNTLPAVQLSGTPSVNINSMPPVNASVTGNVPVSNPLDGSGNPIPLVTEDNAPRAAFDVTEQCNFDPTDGCLISSLFLVPSNQIAVIESFSGECTLASGTAIVFASLIWVTGGHVSSLSVEPGSPLANQGLVEQSFGGNVKRYVFGGSRIVASIGPNGSQSSGDNCEVGLAGYLIQQ